ncbi:MAG: TetR/AcrR family transcriptional regulator [Acidimicrobiia bacterium]
MTQRLTLPQKRARETRQRTLEAASRVFARRGYGQATVEDIATEAEISIGALYHHFSGKEEIFKALLEDHVRTAHHEFEVIGSASSFRGMIEQIAGFWLDHLQSEHEFGDLFLDFVAEASRDPWAREVVGEHQRSDIRLVEGMLAVGQRVGAIRPDLDTKAGATLLFACLQGIDLMQLIDPDGIDLDGLRRPLADLIERFIKGERPEDIGALQAAIPALREQLGKQLHGSDAGGNTKEA